MCCSCFLSFNLSEINLEHIVYTQARAYDSKLECILECILECMYGERMYAKRKLALLHVHFDSVNVSYYYCKCFRVQRVSKQFIIFASCLNCPSLHRNILRFGICHSDILNPNLSNFSIIPNYFS